MNRQEERQRGGRSETDEFRPDRRRKETVSDWGGPHLTESVVSVCSKPSRMARRRGALLLLSTAMLLLFWGLGWRGLWAAEGRWAEITREMLLTGDFFHPAIGGEPYFDKPLLTYWFRAIIALATGILNEFVVRLPSAIAGMAAIWATVNLGTRLWSARTGRLAGWFLLTTYAFLFWGRTGTADAENLAAIILAVAWYWSRRDRLSFSAMQIFYLIVFIGAMTKGLTAVVVPVLIVLPDMLVERRWRLLLRPGHFLAFGIGLLIYLSPFAYASLTQPSDYQSSGLGLVFQENILRYFKPIDHKGPIYLYVYELPLLLLPWPPLFVVAVVGMIEGWRRLDKHTRWLIWAVLLVFLFFTLSGSRRSYYILPILPLCALLMAVFANGMGQPRVERLRRQGLDIQKTVLLGLVAFDLAIPIVLMIAGKTVGFKASLSLHVASLAIGLAALLTAAILRRPSLSNGTDGALWPLMGMAAVLLGGYFCWQQRILETNRTERPFARELQAKVAGLALDRIAIFPKVNPNILFYLQTDTPVQILHTADQLRGFIEPGLPGVVITQNRYTDGLPAEVVGELRKQQNLHEQGQPWESKSSKKEKWVAWFWGRPLATAGKMGAWEGIDRAK